MALKDKEVLIPALKTGLSVLSSAVAEVGAGWHGILSGGSLEAMDRARQNLTYTPDEGSKAGGYLEYLSHTMEPIGIAAEAVNRKFGDTVYDATGSPLLAAGATAVPEALMSLGGLGMARKAIPKSAMNPDIKPTPEMMQKAVTRSLDPFGLHKGENPLEAKMYVGGQAKGVPKRIAENTIPEGEPGVGWRQGPDGEYRFQISDIGAEFKLDPTRALNQRHGAPIANILKHDKLFEMYPDLAKVKVYKTSNPGENGHFSAKWDKDGNFDGARIALSATSRGIKRSETDIMGTMLHELQHWVQVKEKFSPGSSMGKFDTLKTEVLPTKAKSLEGAMKAYENVETLIERAEGAPAKAALKSRQAELMKEIQGTQEQVKILQRLKKGRDGWHYDRTLGEMEARDTTDMWMREKIGMSLEQTTPLINRKMADVGGSHEGIVIDPKTEALMLPPDSPGPLKLRDIRNY